MESIGEKLRTTRESRNLSIEQVARDTHIAKRYLTALEEEDFPLFPGEPYLIGFLRNYSEFLGLSPQDMVSLYKNLKLQEQPAPMDELLEKRRPRASIVVGATIVVVAVIGLLLYILLDRQLGKTPASGSSTAGGTVADTGSPPADAAAPLATGVQLTFDGGMTERTFHRGDALAVKLKGKEYRLLLTDIGSTVTLSTPTGVVNISPNNEKVIDLSGDGKADLRLFVRSVALDETPPSAIIRLNSVIQSDTGSVAQNDAAAQAAGTATVANSSVPAATAPASGNVPAAQSPPQGAAAATAGTAGAVNTPSTLSAIQPAAQPAAATQPSSTAGGAQTPTAATGNQIGAAASTASQAPGSLITTSPQRRAFTVDFTFISGAMFRYTVDGNEKQERFFGAGERLTATAETQFQLWLSNAGAASVIVSGNAVTLGNSGQIATDIIRWTGPTSNGDYRLELVPVN